MSKTDEILKELNDIYNVSATMEREIADGLHNGNIPVIAIASMQSSIDRLNELRISKLNTDD